MNDVALRALCLFDGYGGFELGLRSVARVRTVARVERDAYAASVLVARMGKARLDPAPIWDDVFTFDGYPWRGRVDLVTAGFPCQPFSAAGRQAGVDDARWLWPQIARILGEVRPGWVFLENVPGLVRAGLPYVLSDLASLGFDAEWGLLSAAAVGAPHKRERFWLVAHAQECHAAAVVGSGNGRANVDGDGGWSRSVESEGVADAESVGRHEGIGHEPRRRGTEPQGGSGAWPPRPDDHAGWAEWIAQGGPEPVVRRSLDGPPLGLADALHLGGNGLVPQCAAEAWRQLVARLEVSTTQQPEGVKP